MTNAELITAIRENEECNNCAIYMHGECNERKMSLAAADALEAVEQRIAVVEEERDLERFAAKNYLDKIDELKARIAELESQLPKEGEWIFEDSVCSPRTCSACKQKFYIGRGWNYCPNCGAKMQAVTDCHTLEEGER